MSRFVRASKVRHVFCNPPKAGTDGVIELGGSDGLSTATGDSNYVKCNSRFIAFALQKGGGSLYVTPQETHGRVAPNPPVFDGHKGPIYDLDFNPLDDSLIATAGDDSNICIWQVPDGGLTETCTEPLEKFPAAIKKITGLAWHPTVNMVMGTTSADKKFKLWDLQNVAAVHTFEHPEDVREMIWSYDGNLAMTSCKDNVVRLFDPRKGEATSETQAHAGSKATKLVWLGESSMFATTGFTKQSKRQLKVWDTRKMGKELKCHDLDQGNGVLMPFYDSDTKILLLAGKGDGNVRGHEVIEEDPYEFDIYQLKTSKPCRGMAMMPKKAVDVTKCEVIRMVKLMNKGVEKLSFIIPRKSELFQEDLFPDCYAGKACSEDSAGFLEGKVKGKVIKMSLDPAKRKDVAPGKKAPAAKTHKQLVNDMKNAEDYIKKLEDLLKKNNIKLPERKK